MQKTNRIGQIIKGSAVAGETYLAYIPKPLPPNPPLNLDNFYKMIEQASNTLGRLDGMSALLPDISLFLRMCARKEAVLSSQIEGTQSTLSDLLLSESMKVRETSVDDIDEVKCYIEAMNYGLSRLKEIPLSLGLIREIHAKLMNNSRSRNRQPGEFRKSQNWIGGSRPSKAIYVPPPPERLMKCLDHFEKFLHDESVQLPILAKVALVHVQFESIHPFLDGNGRLGRLLITFMLRMEGVLKEPLLYLSLYFKTYRQAYYNHLQAVNETGDWEGWIRFFLEGIIDTANQTQEVAQSIMKLFSDDRRLIESSEQSATSVSTINAIYADLQRHPISNTASIRKNTGLSQPTVMRSLSALQRLGIIEEITGKSRHKVFVYRVYLDILNKGTEL